MLEVMDRNLSICCYTFTLVVLVVFIGPVIQSSGLLCMWDLEVGRTDLMTMEEWWERNGSGKKDDINLHFF